MQTTAQSIGIGPVVAVKAGFQERLAVLLALIAGYVDAVGYIKWKTYLSFMSGNTTQLGFTISQNKMAVPASGITAIIVFTLGIYAGTCLSFLRNYVKAIMIWIISGLLFTVMIVSTFFSVPPVIDIAIISFAMGMMNTIITSVGPQPVNTDFVTGTLNSMAKQAAIFSMTRKDGNGTLYKRSVGRLVFIWLGFLSGAIAAGLAVHLLDDGLLGLPALVLLITPFFNPVFWFKR